MGLFDTIRIHQKFLQDPIPETLIECHKGREMSFQTKDIDCAMLDFEINEKGELLEDLTEWVDSPSWQLGNINMPGGGLEKNGKQMHRIDFSGGIKAYVSGFGVVDSWPDSDYDDLGWYEVLLYVQDGVVFKTKLIESRDMVKK